MECHNVTLHCGSDVYVMSDVYIVEDFNIRNDVIFQWGAAMQHCIATVMSMSWLTSSSDVIVSHMYRGM